MAGRSDHLQVRFTFREMQAVGFVVEGGKEAWPSFADVFLHVHPNPGRGVEYYYFPSTMNGPDRALPPWAHHAIEQGALHATFIGGPGGVPVADLRIECRQTRHDEQRSGERAYFLAAYAAMRKAIHLATAEAPRFLELDLALRFRLPRSVEDGVTRAIEAEGGTILGVKPIVRTGLVSVRARIAASIRGAVTEIVERASAGGRQNGQQHAAIAAAKLEVEPDGYRSRDGVHARGLLRLLGAPLDWPRNERGDFARKGESAVPVFGDPFPALPFVLQPPLR